LLYLAGVYPFRYETNVLPAEINVRLRQITLLAKETVFASEISGGVLSLSLCINYCSKTYKCDTARQHCSSGTSNGLLQLHNSGDTTAKGFPLDYRNLIFLVFFIGLNVRKARGFSVCARCRGVADAASLT
jgi:hypothetical protein